MSRYTTSRHMPMGDFYPTRDDNTCVKCGRPLTGRQTRWCGKTCGDAAYEEVMILRGSPQVIRNVLILRDKGICAVCGLDTEKRQRALQHAIRWAYITKHRADVWLERVFPGEIWWGPVWHADHIIELADGGKNEMSNFQTLCVPCHKTKSKESAAMRARVRRFFKEIGYVL